MKVVIDTNIYLSGLIFPKSPPGKILELARQKKIEVYISDFILYEIRKVLVIKFDYTEEMAGKFIEEILKFTKIIRPGIKVNEIKDKKDDNHILECAVSAKADYLVSGDKKHILTLKIYRKIKIINARDFLEICIVI